MIEATKTQKEIPADLINTIFSNMQVILPLNRDHLLKGSLPFMPLFPPFLCILILLMEAI